ncbi:MAG: hypothetical protein ACYTEL_01375 [Planctomycetota bacterium]
MKILLRMFLVLVAAGASSATTTVTLVPIEEGEPGSATNPLEPSETICVYATSDAGLLGLDAVLCVVSGPATIIDAISREPGAGPCLSSVFVDPGACFDPLPPPPATCVEIGVGYFAIPPSGIVGWWLLRCDGEGLVTVELTPGTAFGGSMDMNFQVPDIFGILEIHQAEPTCWDAGECAGQPNGDASCDGNVDLGDLYALKAAFGSSAPWTAPECCADFDQDGSVGLADLFILKANYGKTGLSPSTGNQSCP